MSDYSELWERFETYGAAEFESFVDWAASGRLPGRLGGYYAERAPGSWWMEAFRTFKAMKARGVEFIGQALAFPEARTVAELFEVARYVQNPPGGLYRSEAETFTRTKAEGEGFLFVSGRGIGATGAEIAPCGHVGGVRAWSSTGHRSISGAVFHSTYARPLPEVLAWWGSYDGPDAEGFALSSFELVQHDTGRILVIGRSRYGSRWLAYLDAGQTMESLMPDSDRAVIAEERARDLAAWGDSAAAVSHLRTAGEIRGER